MLSTDPASLTSAENGNPTATPWLQSLTLTMPPYDLTVKVTALPPHGTVFKEDGVAKVGLGQVVTARKLVALKFRPAIAQARMATGSTLKLAPEGWLVVGVPLNDEPSVIGVQVSGI